MNEGFPKGGGGGVSDVWEKFPNNPVFFLRASLIEFLNCPKDKCYHIQKFYLKCIYPPGCFLAIVLCFVICWPSPPPTQPNPTPTPSNPTAPTTFLEPLISLQVTDLYSYRQIVLIILSIIYFKGFRQSCHRLLLQSTSQITPLH